ncbi:hypothetical protein RRG08_049283 [Elysia crispata]|uniref:Uncharacterized protein n=1 Tax=Elysia crispata TaxID=231223 RepID=A0AAE0ZNM9_9GAST|nr:hypothetical protein RRG08_049283 [Elysia crispata]
MTCLIDGEGEKNKIAARKLEGKITLGVSTQVGGEDHSGSVDASWRGRSLWECRRKLEGKITLRVSTWEGEATLEKGDDGILVTFIDSSSREITSTYALIKFIFPRAHVHLRDFTPAETADSEDLVIAAI